MNNNVAALIEEHRVLADLIALEYLNIPRCQLDDVRSEACLALLHAAEGFDSRMGEFPAYASRAIRNRLNSLYAKQIRLAKMFPMSIDEAGSSSSQTSGDRALKVTDSSALSDAKGDVLRDLRQRETCAILGTVLKELSPRERILIEAIRSGQSYREVADQLQISKQAAHRATRNALHKLRSSLEKLGYRGIASDGEIGSK